MIPGSGMHQVGTLLSHHWEPCCEGGSCELLLMRREVGEYFPCVPEERLYKRDEIQLRGERAHRGGDDRLELLAAVSLPRQDKGNMAILQSGTAMPGAIGLGEVKAL